MNKLNDTQAVIDACAARPDIAPFARIVGRWVWCEFPDKPSEEARAFLKETGFRWNKERLAWQHACGHFTRRNRRIDPRAVYGQQAIEYTNDAQPAPRPTYRDRVAEELSRFQSI